MTASYPETSRDRNRWILRRRTERNALAPHRPYAFLIEEERAESGEVIPVATIFLTNRECPWRCLMCDLWKNTLADTVPPGAIPAQINYAFCRCVGFGEVLGLPAMFRAAPGALARDEPATDRVSGIHLPAVPGGPMRLTFFGVAPASRVLACRRCRADQ